MAQFGYVAHLTCTRGRHDSHSSSGDSVDMLGPPPESLLDAAAELVPATDPSFDAQAAIQAAQAAQAAVEQDGGQVNVSQGGETGWEALQSGLSGVDAVGVDADVDTAVEPAAPQSQLTRGQVDLLVTSMNVVRRQLGAAIEYLAGVDQTQRYGPFFEDGLKALSEGIMAQVEAADAIRARACEIIAVSPVVTVLKQAAEMLPSESRDLAVAGSSSHIDPALRGERDSGLPMYTPFLISRERRGVKRAREPTRKRQESNPEETRKQRMLRLEVGQAAQPY